MPASGSEQGPSLRAVKTAKRLVENGQPHFALVQSAPQPHPLPFASRHQSSTFAEFGLQPIGQFPEHLVQFGFVEEFSRGQRIAVRTVAKIVEQGTVPDLHGRVDPGSLGSQPFHARTF